MSKKPQLTFKGNNIPAAESNGGPRVSLPSGSNPKVQSKLYEQLCKSTGPSSNAPRPPLSWHPDLEIEALEPDSEESSWRLRVEELGNA
jgi:hypothetical protein